MSNENEKTNKEELAKAEIQVEIEKANEVVYGEVLDFEKRKLSIDVRGIVTKMFQILDFADFANNIEIGKEYILEIPKEFREGLKNGDNWIMKNAKEDGKYWPNIMCKNEAGKHVIAKPLGIKEKEILHGNPLEELSNKFQNAYLQGQVQRVAELAEATYRQVKELEVLNLDEKIGRISSGQKRLYLAVNQKDNASRTTAIHLALADISTAREQIFATFQRKTESCINVPKSPIMQIVKETLATTGFVDEAINDYEKLQKYYDLYIYATELIASAYLFMDEKENAKRVFEQSLEDMSKIDTKRLESIKNLKDNKIKFEGICNGLIEPITKQEQLCIDSSENTDTMLIEITGKELLEAYEDGN